jgi:hypothetical protein
MGDSSVSCVLTGVTLTSQRVVLLALAPARYAAPSRTRPSIAAGARVISNEGARAWFDPVLLPIFGRMDSYGHLTDIESDEHTAFLEARLGMSILEIADAIIDGAQPEAMKRFARQAARGSSSKRLAWDGRLYGCFIARQAWEAFSTTFVNEWGKPAFSVWHESWLSPDVLRGLGFVKGAKDVTRARELLGEGQQAGDRYHTPYTHPKIADLVIWSDTSFSSRPTLGDVDLSKKLSIYRPAELQKALLKYKRTLPKAAIAWAEATPSVLLEFHAARRSHNRELKRRREERERIDVHPELQFELVADTTPESIRNENNELVRAAMNQRARKWFGPSDEPSTQADTPEDSTEAPEPTLAVPRGAVQTFCDGRTHVILMAADDNTAINPIVCDCDKGPACAQPSHRRGDLHWVTLPFPTGVRDELKARGWKAKSNWPLRGYGDSPIMRMVAPELPVIYRKALLRDFVDRMVALCTMLQTMSAANRLLQPTNTGYQYGHLYIQRQVAQLATRMLTQRIDAQRKWRE